MAAERATVGQVAALASERLGAEIVEDKVHYAIEALVADGRIKGTKDGKGAYVLTARETYVVLGEVIRRRAGWNKRANVRAGFEAWVEGDELGRRVMLLPWQRGWDKATGRETMAVPATISCCEYPTGRVTGQLTMTGADAGLPVFTWSAVTP